MFSCVVAGRLPLTNPQQVDETHAVFQLEQAQDINHVTVFMTGQQAFPPGYSATVHFLWPGEGKQWSLLGCLRNSKPSAIFRLKGNAIPSSSSTSSSALFSSNPSDPSSSPSTNAFLGATTQPASVTAALGISIEPDQAVDAQMDALQSAGGGASNVNGSGVATGGERSLNEALNIAPKIAKNAFDYLSSFAPDSAPQTAPLLQKWLEQFERKLRMQGASFLEKE